jgi:indolepyruvate ferredoxin oxidoreductase
LVAAIQPEALGSVAHGRTWIIGNSDITATADFQVSRDQVVSEEALVQRLVAAGGREPLLLPASTLSEELLGDSIAANVLMLGYAWQRGLIPLSAASIEKAMELNGKATKANIQAFNAGRLAATTRLHRPLMAH